MAVILHGARVVPGNSASAFISGPGSPVTALAPNDVERGADNMPGAVIVVPDIFYNTPRELNQGKTEEGPFGIGGPVHIISAGLMTARTAGIVGPNISGRRYSGRSPFYSLRTEFCKRNAGVGAVRPVDGVGQLITEGGKIAARGVVLRPGVILLVCCSVQTVTVQLSGVALGEADSNGQLVHSDHQRVAVGHGLPLKLGQLFRHSIGGGNDILKPS